MSCVSGSTSTSSQHPSVNDGSSTRGAATSSAMTGYLKDHFNVSFVDCKCCCDASKEMSRCQTDTPGFLRDIQDYIVLPEYRLNCRCICGDNEQNNTPVKFGLNLTPANDLK